MKKKKKENNLKKSCYLATSRTLIVFITVCYPKNNSNADLDFNAFTYMVTTHLFQPIKTINFLEVAKKH
jgi:hypothetical protein